MSICRWPARSQEQWLSAELTCNNLCLVCQSDALGCVHIWRESTNAAFACDAAKATSNRCIFV